MNFPFEKFIKTLPASIADNYKPVVWIYSKTDVRVAFSYIITHLKRTYITYQYTSLESTDVDRLKLDQLLYTTFLGSSHLYSIMCVGDKGSHELLQERLNKYSGPHCIVVYSTDPLNVSDAMTDNIQYIEIPEFIDFNGCVDLLPVISSNKEHQKNAHYIATQLFKRSKKWPLETICALAYYAPLFDINSPSAVAMANYFAQLYGFQHSLFLLSQQFFSGKIPLFLSLWKEHSEIYPEQFWISFWSDQIWRAFFYLNYLKQGQHTQAKKIAFRLPFSFIERDWRLWDYIALQKLHTQLYQLDSKAKQGATYMALETLLLDGLLSIV